MTLLIQSQSRTCEFVSDRHEHRSAAGIQELQLRRKLLQQQLGAVNERCNRVAGVVARKNLAKKSAPKSNNPCTSRRDGSSSTQDREYRGQIVAHESLIEGCGGQTHTRAAKLISKSEGRAFWHKNEGRSIMVDSLCQRPRQDFISAIPFKKGGRIDYMNKKHMLKNKERDINRQAVTAQRRQEYQKIQSVRSEVPVVPSIFPYRYLRGEVPCSKHCSAGVKLDSRSKPADLHYHYATSKRFRDVSEVLHRTPANCPSPTCTMYLFFVVCLR